jgi:hypothetical protein
MAYEITLNPNLSIDQVEESVSIEKIRDETYESESLNSKLDIMKEKVKIVSEFEQKFNKYKSTILNLNNDIINLRKVYYNLLEITQLKQEKINIKTKYTQDISLLKEIHKDEYIPSVYACYMSTPIYNEKYRERFINRHILRTMIEKYGIKKIFSSTHLENGIINDFIRSQQFGKLEQDGIRNYDGKGINEIDTHKNSKCFKIYFVRFKPFFNVSMIDHQAAENNIKSINANIKLWDLSKQNSFSALSKEVSKIFVNNTYTQTELSNLQTYIISLGDISKAVKSSQKRIQKIVQSFREIELEFQERFTFYNQNIERLEDINNKLLSKIGIYKACSKNDIDKLIENKRKRKQQIEKNFEYQFVIMDSQSPNPSFENALNHILENIFDKIDIMVKQQAMSIECIVNMGIVQKNTEKIMSFQHNYTKVNIKPFIDKGDVGVMLSLSVKYEALSSNSITNKHKEKNKKISPFVEIKDEFIEHAMDINIQMTQINNGDHSFYMSKTDISKNQFMIFLRDTHKDIETYVGDRFCLNLIKSYPDDFPMICVSETGVRKFINWLCIKSGKKYNLPTSNQIMIASQFKMYKGNGFRIVLSK